MNPSTTTQQLSKNGQALPLENLTAWQDFWIAAGLFLVGLLTRLPFPEQLFYHWDSINFAMSLRSFNVWLGQPQVPGYILYVGLARLVNFFVGNAQTTLVAISMVSGALAVAFLYLLGRDMFNRRVGIIAALFLAASPLFWFYGELALPHTTDAFMVIVFVWMSYRIMRGDHRLAIPAAIWLAIAGGMRPQTELFLAPLALYAGWFLGWKRGLIAGTILAVLDFAWFIPLIVMTGGLARYLFIMSQFTAAFDATTSVFKGAGLFGLERNTTKLVMYTLYGWGMAVLPFGFAAIKVALTDRKQALSFGKGGWLSDRRFWVFVLWLAPSLFYYLMVHMGQQGLTFVYLPGLLLLSAVGVVYLLQNWAALGRLAVAGLIVVNSLIFLIAPAYPLGANSFKILTVDTIRAHDRLLQDRITAIQKDFPAQSTLILSSAYRFPQYYLPNHVFLPFTIVAKWEEDQGQPAQIIPNFIDPKLTGGTSGGSGYYYALRPDTVDPAQYGLHPDAQGYYYLILFDDNLIPFYQGAGTVKTITFADGSTMTYVRFNAQQRIHFTPDSYQIVSAAGVN